ncbi:MAG: hypothetical protein KDE51_20775 [Anaerolineales bacterium]|nr:hypothetical protein [Anaerolineales bacterium]
MGAGEARTYTTQTSFTQAGNYWIYAQVDTDGSVIETNENNNRLGGCSIHAFTVTGTSRSNDDAPTAVPNAPRSTPTPAAIETTTPALTSTDVARPVVPNATVVITSTVDLNRERITITPTPEGE